MNRVLLVIFVVALTLALAGVPLAQMSRQTSEGHSAGMMGSGVMGGGQMGQMMPMMQMMQACTQMMQQMSAMMGQHGTPQPQHQQPEKK